MGGIWGQTRSLGTGRANRGTGTIFGAGVRIFDTSELTQPPVGWSNRAAAPTYGDRLDFAESQIWGQTRNLGRRTVDLVDLTKPRSDGRGQPQRPEYGDRHDVRYADRERLTSNAQLSTFNGVTERVQGGRDMGTDTMFGRWAVQIEGQTRYFARTDGLPARLTRPKRRSGGPSLLWRPDMVTGTMSGIPIRNV